jgi:hypothetical protein
MGAIARNAANLITTSGVVLKGAVNNDSFDNVTALPSAFSEDGITLISSQTASNSASISFTTGIDSTYKAYKFVFSNINPATDTVYFQFNLSTDSGSNYNVTKTTTYFHAYQSENGAGFDLNYDTGRDLAQSTSFQDIMYGIGNGADESGSGSLTLFNPSSTTYVKHFIATTNAYSGQALDYTINSYIAGYGNTTSAVNAVRFLFSSGNIDAGTIYLYGIK